jgi:Flp pilus assembly protein TadD
VKDKVSMEQVRVTAINRLEEALGIMPQDSKMHALLATLYSSQDKSKAVSQIQTALALSPKDAGVLSNAAIVYEAMGNRREAIRYAHESLQNGNTLNDLQVQAGLQGVLSDQSFHSREK